LSALGKSENCAYSLPVMVVLTLPPAGFPLHPLWRCVHFLPVTFVSQTGRAGWWLGGWVVGWFPRWLGGLSLSGSLQALAVEKCATQNQRAQENEMKVVLGERRAETEISSSSEKWAVVGGGSQKNKKKERGNMPRTVLQKVFAQSERLAKNSSATEWSQKRGVKLKSASANK